MGLHPFFHIVYKQSGNVQQDHESTGDGQSQNGSFSGAGFNDSNSLIYKMEENKKIKKKHEISEFEDRLWLKSFVEIYL